MERTPLLVSKGGNVEGINKLGKESNNEKRKKLKISEMEVRE